jgi:hypothetical protein
MKLRLSVRFVSKLGGYICHLYALPCTTFKPVKNYFDCRQTIPAAERFVDDHFPVVRRSFPRCSTSFHRLVSGLFMRSVPQSVCWSITAFHGLGCHPWPCMLLNLRLGADSIPSALTIYRSLSLGRDRGASTRPLCSRAFGSQETPSFAKEIRVLTDPAWLLYPTGYRQRLSCLR